ncbi:MAG: serine hydrolase [Candidatus Caenarcaniphilales bacterium]|nr:serine hydrolase [Candidatus Caenarcaniphilales bacterium]
MTPNLQTLSQIINIKSLEILQKTGKIQRVSLTVIDLENPSSVVSINGDVQRYPASVVKLFWAIQSLVELQESKELDLLLGKMIVDSDDWAGQQIVDKLCGKDPQDPKDFEKAYEKRRKLETFWHKLGYKTLKAAHKTFLNEYSEFDDWIKQNKSQNSVTSGMVADLWKKLWVNDPSLGLTENKREKLLNWLRREPLHQALKPEEKNFQASLLGYNLPPEAVLYTKSGWRDNTINDSGVIVSNKANKKLGQNSVIVVLSELGESEGIDFLRSLFLNCLY